MSNEMSSFRQSGKKLNMFNLFRQCRKDEISFHIVAETGNIVAKNGNNVEETFDFVEWLVRVVAFDSVADVDGALFSTGSTNGSNDGFVHSEWFLPLRKKSRLFTFLTIYISFRIYETTMNQINNTVHSVRIEQFGTGVGQTDGRTNRRQTTVDMR